MAFVVVGGVPGSGKSTAMLPYRNVPGIHVVDPDRLRPLLRRRPLVHTVHQALVWAAVLTGPSLVGTLLIQDTATRTRRREALLRAALARGWDTHLILIDVTREQARAGQAARGRISPPAAFDRHWRRWTRLRDNLGSVGVTAELVTRDEVAGVLEQILRDAGVLSPQS